MNMFRKYFLLLLTGLFVSLSAYPLSNFQDKFADNLAIGNGAFVETRWYELQHMHYIDFLLEPSAGSGTLTVQYASENPVKVATATIIDDTTVAPFAAGTPASVIGGVITKNFVRLRIDCTAGPCTIDSGVFTSKGRRNR